MNSMEDQGVVYVIIPTYNRVDLTINCIRLLLEQTYRNICIIISDGNSSDGTQEMLVKRYPDVVLLRSKKTLWWSEAMAKGIDYVLDTSLSDNDYVLMMNDDTEFTCDYVEKMVKSVNSKTRVVGSLMADISKPDVILGAGIHIDWDMYSFTTKYSIKDGRTIIENIDTLPARGTILPVEIIRDAGNINYKRLPHYLADYEYFCRVKRCGYDLCVTTEAKIMVHMGRTGKLKDKNMDYSIFKKIYFMTSRRSQSNKFDQFNFIDLAAPDQIKEELKRKVLPGIFGSVISYIGRSSFH